MNIIDKIDQYLISDEKKQSERKRESYYPSEAFSCSRKLFYRWTGIKQSDPTNAGSILKMKIGNSTETIINDLILKSGIVSDGKLRFKKDIGLKYLISGELDNVIYDDNGRKCGLEIKTSYGNGIRAIKKNGIKQEYIDQVVVYMECAELDKYYLIYFARDDGYRCQFEFTKINNEYYLDGLKIENRFNAFVKKLQKLENCIDNNILPDRDFRAAIKKGFIVPKFQKNNIEYKTDWQCSYCNWLNHCWLEELNKYRDSDNSEMFVDILDIGW